MNETGDTPTIVLTHRHDFSRLPPDAANAILETASGIQAAAKVHRESIVGVSLSLENTVELTKNDRVNVICGHVVIAAIVRRLDLNDRGAIVVALEWAEPPVD